MTKTPTRKPAAKKAPSKPAKRATPRAPAPTKAPRKHRSPPPAPANKQAQIIARLRSGEGATLSSLVELTGWQPHTVRGTISGVLRKKLNLNVVCESTASGARTYRIVEATA